MLICISTTKGFHPQDYQQLRNNIRRYKDTSVDGDLTTGNTIINGDLTVTGNFAYTGDDSHTKSEIDDRLDLSK